MIETELGTLRRSHYSDEISSSLDGSDVIVMGWVVTIRGHGNISFATIRDKNGDLPIVAKKGDCPDDVREKISSLKAHSSIAIVGKVKSSEKSPVGFEIIPNELRVFSEVEKIPPFEPTAKTVKNIDTLATAFRVKGVKLSHQIPMNFSLKKLISLFYSFVLRGVQSQKLYLSLMVHH